MQLLNNLHYVLLSQNQALIWTVNAEQVSGKPENPSPMFKIKISSYVTIWTSSETRQYYHQATSTSNDEITQTCKCA